MTRPSAFLSRAHHVTGRESVAAGGVPFTCALGHGIHTQGDSLEEIRRNVKEAVDCYFDDTMPRPKVIRLHFVREELLVA